MRKLLNTLTAIKAIIVIAGFAGIASLYELAKKLEKNSNNRLITYSVIAGLITITAFIYFLILFYEHRIKRNKAYIIDKYFDDYINNHGQTFIKNLSKKGDELIKKTKLSISGLMKKGTTNTLDQEVYYMYLFSLLSGATKRVWAASILADEEWVDTPEEDEFLRLNLAASARRVLVERIFIIKQQHIKDIVENKAIKLLIDKRDDYMKTYFILESDLLKTKPKLLAGVGNGFLAFDDFAIAEDAFEDNFIRGILTLEEETIGIKNRIFTNLRDFARPLDKESLENLDKGSSHL